MVLVLIACSSIACSDSEHEVADPKPVADAGGSTLEAEAYVWGYPLVVTRRTLQTFAPVIGVNQLFNQAAPSGAATRFIVSPNVDTLYSVAVLDLRAEPLVLSVPDATDRYWTYQFLDAWTNSFAYLGTRATAGKGGTFVITPPGWTGALPSGAQRIESPTPVGFLLGRFLFRDPADTANVVALERTLKPLHEVVGGPAPSAPPALGAALGTAQEVADSGGSFYDELGDSLALAGTASPFDTEELARFASLGIGAGLHPFAAGDATKKATLSEGAATGNLLIENEASVGAPPGQAFTVRLDVGTYSSDSSLQRAAIAQFLWGANVPEESVYALSVHDANGAPYTGDQRYRVHFASGQLPPYATEGFWSMTMYGPDHFFVANSADVYAVGDRTQGLTENADGSLDIYVQSTAPTGHEANWLPSPESGPFRLMLRIYLPAQAVTAGQYVYPTVTRIP
ncbi:MAG: DUF1254 domain-containing protein [Myxococcales bacterium]